MNTKRQKYMNFRLSDSEYQQLQARIKNSGLNTQQFMLRAVLEKPIVNKEVFQGFLIELRYQGNNLNQIAKSCNSGHSYEAAESAIAAAHKLERLWQQIRLFLELEYRGVNLKKLAEACGSADDEQEEYKIIREELDKVCQYLKL